MGRDIAKERVALYDAFRASLTLKEKADLDAQLQAVCEALRGNGSFGVMMGKEILIALIEFAHERKTC